MLPHPRPPLCEIDTRREDLHRISGMKYNIPVLEVGTLNSTCTMNSYNHAALTHALCPACYNLIMSPAEFVDVGNQNGVFSLAIPAILALRRRHPDLSLSTFVFRRCCSTASGFLYGGRATENMHMRVENQA